MISNYTTLFPVVQSHFQLIDITETENKFMAGTEKILSFVVKDTINLLCETLDHILNIVLKTQFYPNLWKRSQVIPVLVSRSKY